MRKRTVAMLFVLVAFLGLGFFAFVALQEDDGSDSHWLQTKARDLSYRMFGWPRPRISFVWTCSPADFTLFIDDTQLFAAATSHSATHIGVQHKQFTLNTQPTFLLGMSYYAALGAPKEIRDRDLAELKRLGFNWIRLWANWAAFDNDVSVVDVEGRPREEYLAKLKDLVAHCDAIGMIVDVSLSRGNGITGPPRLQSLEAHQRAVEAIVNELKE